MRHQAALAVALCVIGLLHSSCGQGSKTAYVPANSTLVSALDDAAVNTIILTADYTLQPDQVKGLSEHPMKINRSVTIKGLPGQCPILGLSRIPGVFELCNSCTLTLSNLALANETYAGIGADVSPFRGSLPGSKVVQQGGYSLRPVCASTAATLAINNNTQRSAAFPGPNGTSAQLVTSGNFTFRGKPYFNMVTTIDSSQDVPLSLVSGGGFIGGYSLGYGVSRAEDPRPAVATVPGSKRFCCLTVNEVMAPPLPPGGSAYDPGRTAAIAAPVAVVGALLLAGLVWLLVRRHSQAQKVMQPGGGSPTSTTPCTAGWAWAQPRAAALEDNTGRLVAEQLWRQQLVLLQMGSPSACSSVRAALGVCMQVITHSSADDDRISEELALSTSFDHPNLVRTLHYTKIDIGPNNPEASLGTPSISGDDLFLPEGAVGVFDIDSNWAVMKQLTAKMEQQGAGIDSETWVVMDLMDQGNLAKAIRQGQIFMQDLGSGTLKMACLLRRAADVAAGLSHLHSWSVCHGDLKCENVLLRSEKRDPDGVMAQVADFGLSRALAEGQTHLSTRRYGTVTHMPPELLVAGKLSPAADTYSFGIMMWEFVSGAVPFAGMHPGEIIHRVVTEDLRPGPWPSQAVQQLPAGYVPLAEACWARQASARPLMSRVLLLLLDMLTEVEGQQGV